MVSVAPVKDDGFKNQPGSETHPSITVLLIWSNKSWVSGSSSDKFIVWKTGRPEDI
jgi:hypothetical protein